MRVSTTTVRIVGRYALYHPIAAGGMATVYLGRLVGPVGFSRTVAVKRLHPQFASDPEFVAMFVDEARLATRIRHPNVVPTLDVVQTDGELFLVMDYVHGESLSKLLRIAAAESKPIPVSVVVAIMSGVLQGLGAAHEAKSERGVPLQIVHRDVSPQNILLGADGQARLLDFGVARAIGRSQTTRQGQIKGKLAYMPPEQLRGDEVGPTADIYAAAIVLWEALTTRRFFRGEGAESLAEAVLAGEVEPPSQALTKAGELARAEVVAPLDDAIMRALARRKEFRWQSARELARVLEATVVPATVTQVADWLEESAGELIVERGRIVAEIEHLSALDMSSEEIGRAIAATHPGSDVDPRVSTPPTGFTPVAVETERTTGSVVQTIDTLTRHEPVDPEPTGTEPAASRAHGFRIAPFLALAASVLVIGLLMLARRPSTAAIAAAPVGSPLKATSPPAVDADPSPPGASAAVEGETSRASAETPTLEAIPSPSSSGLKKRLGALTVDAGRSGSPRPAPPPSPPARAAPPCDPPYTYDKEGVKHYKDECF